LYESAEDAAGAPLAACWARIALSDWGAPLGAASPGHPAAAAPAAGGPPRWSRLQSWSNVASWNTVFFSAPPVGEDAAPKGLGSPKGSALPKRSLEAGGGGAKRSSVWAGAGALRGAYSFGAPAGVSCPGSGCTPGLEPFHGSRTRVKRPGFSRPPGHPVTLREARHGPWGCLAYSE